MKELAKRLDEQGISFDPLDNRIACYPHIINICVSHIIQSLGQNNLADLEDDDDDNYSDDDGYDGEGDDDSIEGLEPKEYIDDEDLVDWFDALKRNPVRRARLVVRTLRVSGQRRDEFENFIQKGNDCNLFHDDDNNPIKLRHLQLLRDVKNRWDSLYLMLQRLREMQPVRIFPDMMLT
jgi:hypothetical protein